MDINYYNNVTKCLGTTTEIKINTNIYILYAKNSESPHIPVSKYLI